MMRRFHLERDEDASGVSGTGRVAEGVVFSDGTTILRWTPDATVNPPSTVIYDRIFDVTHIHGHGGLTRIVFDDEPEPVLTP